MKATTETKTKRRHTPTVDDYITRLRCLTDNVLIELHEEAFASPKGKRWAQPIPVWAYREDLERRLAHLYAGCACTLKKGHPARTKLLLEAEHVLRAPIRIAPADRYPVITKEQFEESLGGKPVLTSERQRADGDRNQFYLRDLILENPGMDYATFRARYGHVMPTVTRASFDSTRSSLRKAGYAVVRFR